MPHQLPDADILVHSGDFTTIGSRDEIESFIRWTDDLLAKGTVHDIVFVAGNHDLSLPLTAKHPAVRASQAAMKERLTNRSHCVYLEDSGAVVQGVSFYGSPWTSRCGRDWAFQALDVDRPFEGGQAAAQSSSAAAPTSVCADEGLGTIFSRIPCDIDVLVTHQPPKGHGDCVSAAHGTGSKELLEHVLRVDPVLHVCGHIHPGHGVSTRPGCRTVFVNAAICDDDMRPVQQPVIVTFTHSGSSGASAE